MLELYGPERLMQAAVEYGPSTNKFTCTRPLHYRRPLLLTTHAFSNTNIIIAMSCGTRYQKWDTFIIPSEVSSKNVTFGCPYDANIAG
jgi:hypothetical protein